MNNDSSDQSANASAQYTGLQSTEMVQPPPQAAPKGSGGGLGGFMFKKLHQWDLFAKPITLRYNGKGSMTTIPGGILTVIFLSFYYGFAATTFVDFVLNAEAIQNTNDHKVNLFDDQKQWKITTDRVNLLHKIGSEDETIRANLGRYVGAQYVQVDTTYNSPTDGYYNSISCLDAYTEEELNKISADDESFRYFAKRLQCPDTKDVQLRGSNLMTSLFKQDMADNPVLRQLTGMEFRLVINTCTDIWGQDGTKCELDVNKVNEALQQIYVDITVLYEYLDRDEQSGRYYNRSAVSPIERYFLGNANSNLVEKQLKEKDTTINLDWIFGTSLIQTKQVLYTLTGQEQRTFQRVQKKNILVHPIDPTLASVNNYLLTVRLQQNPFKEYVVVHPVSIYQFLMLLFALWFLLLNIGRQILQKYLPFVFNKSIINTLYFYSRQKQNVSSSRKKPDEDQNQSIEIDQETIEIDKEKTPIFDRKEIQEKSDKVSEQNASEGSFKQKHYAKNEKQFQEEHEKDNLMDHIKEGHAISELEQEENGDDSLNELSEEEQKELTLRKRLFRAVMFSKSHLYFGYKHTYILKYLRYFKCLCCCCPMTKWCKRKYQRYTINEKRMQNAGPKISDELDLINIVKRLRVNQFIANLTLTPYQQQAINYFYEYSLENKYAKQKEWKNLKVEELADIINDNMQNPINQLINQKVIGEDSAEEVDEDDYADPAKKTMTVKKMQTGFRGEMQSKRFDPSIYLDGKNQHDSSDGHDSDEQLEERKNTELFNNLYTKQQTYLEQKGHSLFVTGNPQNKVSSYQKLKTKKQHRGTFGTGEVPLRFSTNAPQFGRESGTKKSIN